MLCFGTRSAWAGDPDEALERLLKLVMNEEDEGPQAFNQPLRIASGCRDFRPLTIPPQGQNTYAAHLTGKLLGLDYQKALSLLERRGLVTYGPGSPVGVGAVAPEELMNFLGEYGGQFRLSVVAPRTHLAPQCLDWARNATDNSCLVFFGKHLPQQRSMGYVALLNREGILNPRSGEITSSMRDFYFWERPGHASIYEMVKAPSTWKSILGKGAKGLGAGFAVGFPADFAGRWGARKCGLGEEGQHWVGSASGYLAGGAAAGWITGAGACATVFNPIALIIAGSVAMNTSPFGERVNRQVMEHRVKLWEYEDKVHKNPDSSVWDKLKASAPGLVESCIPG